MSVIQKRILGLNHFYNTNLNRNGSKRGQVTIFIIVAIIIVAVILFSYFYLYPKFFSQADSRPMLDRCIQDEMERQVNQLSLSAGLLGSDFNTMYMDENISFVCYTNEFYKPGVVLHPFLKNDFENSLSRVMAPVIQDCYDRAIDELVARGNDVISGNIKSNLTIDMNGINILIDAPTSITNSDGSGKIIKNFNVNLPSNIYTILMIANSILQFESSYGDSDVSSFMFYYPNLNVQKIRRDDSVKIYIITDKKDIKYRFATRSYAWPAGYGSLNG